MAKLYFRYGTMDSAKSMNLLAVAHNYRKQGKRVVLMKPRLDTRFGAEKISSRSGLEATADLMIVLALGIAAMFELELPVDLSRLGATTSRVIAR